MGATETLTSESRFRGAEVPVGLTRSGWSEHGHFLP